MRSAVCIGLIALLGSRAAAGPSVTLRVERTTVQLNTPFMILIEASGGRVENPVIPDVDGLKIDQYPSHTSSRTEVSIVNFSSSVIRVRELGYGAEATRTGKVQIPPIGVRIDGRLLHTQPVVLNVVDVPAPTVGRPSYRGVSRTPIPPRERSGSKETELAWERLAFITSTVDKGEVYQGEPVLLRLQLWRILADGVSVGARRGADLRYPDTEGFYATTFEPRVSREEQDGWTYEVAEYRQLLYPTVRGELTIGPWHWEGSARALTRLGTQQRNYDLDTPPITITVRPLPDPPPGFSGAVGNFNFEARVSRTEVIQGTPIRLEMTITGQGNPKAVGEPQLSSIDGAYVSDPEKETQPLGDGVSVVKTIVYSITALEPGEMTIPETGFCYFDPDSETYETLKNGPFTVHVLASAESERRVLGGEPFLMEEGSVDVIGEDIQPIVTNPGRLRPYRTSAAAGAAVLVAPALGYSVLGLWMRRKRRFERDIGFARDYRAKSKCRKRLKAVEQSNKSSEDLYRALIGFVADKFDMPEAGMTSADAQELFRSKGIGAELVTTFTKVLQACERARYADARLSQDEVRALTHAALSTIDGLDTALKHSDKAAAVKAGRP